MRDISGSIISEWGRYSPQTPFTLTAPEEFSSEDEEKDSTFLLQVNTSPEVFNSWGKQIELTPFCWGTTPSLFGVIPSHCTLNYPG